MIYLGLTFYALVLLVGWCLCRAAARLKEPEIPANRVTGVEGGVVDNDYRQLL